MDDDFLDLDSVGFAPGELTAERLALLTLDEAHDLLRLLQTVAQVEGPLLPDAGRWAREIAARIPSES
ncbi:DUF6417 family protein [Streptomyces sp. IB201691-2A2]|uniref:DUF6417 family protein n=1 Tax=Streptomyces sp. IB201691-2A2 TaxID=2561920 RepID=UPI0011805D03|nr:DUF6417 family protein [Streptomyces sp. IB201691-2A2]TRO56317.1 hypothetical protein E4K73_46905 [Streptomyces sp. IB201691-2A2]